MAASQPANFNLQEFTDAGQLLVGGRLYTYAFGTTAHKTAFTDPDGVVPHTYTPDSTGDQYIALNARGELPAPLYLGTGSYDLSLKRADGSTVWTRKAEGVENSIRSLMDSLAAPDSAALIRFIQPAPDAVARPTQDKLCEVVSLEDFKLTTEADWSNAANRACAHCFKTGARLQLQGRKYPGARIEVHGTFDVEGNGATVDFLGVGYTIIAGAGAGTSAGPTPWILDPAIYNAAAYVPSMHGIATAVAVGDNTVTLASVDELNEGDILFLAGNPTSASSNGNYIPASFEFAQIHSIANNIVTLNGRTRNTYTTSGAAFNVPGLARNCRISNLRLKSSSAEAYQLTIRSALNVVIDNIEFAGRDTLGSATFVEGLTLHNLRTSGAGGNWSFARGTVAALLDGLLFQYRSGMTADTNGIFIEESCYDISIRSVRGYGASFSVRQMDMTGAVIRRAITVLDSTFDTANAPGGATSPFQCGTAAGVDIECVNSTFAGAVVTPNPGSYPGIADDALCWITGNQTNDRIKFSACHFKSATAGASFKTGSGALGSILFDDLCTYEGCDAPAAQYTPRGAWTPLVLAGSFTAIGGFSAPAYRIENKQVFYAGAVRVNGAASGDTLSVLPSRLRPPANKLLPAGSAQTGDGGVGSVLFSLDASGTLSARWSAGVAYFGLEGLSYALDA